jgi:hypothetical protein
LTIVNARGVPLEIVGENGGADQNAAIAATSRTARSATTANVSDRATPYARRSFVIQAIRSA